MKIIIPMAGTGTRFVNAGYTTPKPLIKIDGKPMIEYIVKDMFKGETDFIFICSSKHLAETPMRAILQRIAPQGRIVEIPLHRLGPVHSVLQASHLIDDEEPVTINYCDCAVDWDYEEFKREVEKRKCVASAAAFRGFHPPHAVRDHLYYAYMKENNNYLQEIREKIPYTKDKKAEFASTGTHYFAKGRYIKKYFKELIDRKITVKGEYYVSLVNNLLVEDGLDVYIHEVSHFLSWGTPYELEEYSYWSDYFINKRLFKPKKEFDCQILIPMAGLGTRFTKQGYKVPKPLIQVNGLPMTAMAIKHLPKSNKYIFVALKQHIQNDELKDMIVPHISNEPIVIGLDELTKGGVCTCLKAASILDKERPLLISACDYGLVWDEEEFYKLVADESNDAIVWTFKNYPGANYSPQMYSWVDEDGGVVKRISTKLPVSDNPKNDPCIVGSFWFRRAQDFIDSANDFVKAGLSTGGEFHTEGCIDHLLKRGKKAVTFDVDRFVCWGTPDDLRTFEYWNDYFTKVGLKQKTKDI